MTPIDNLLIRSIVPGVWNTAAYIPIFVNNTRLRFLIRFNVHLPIQRTMMYYFTSPVDQPQ